METANSTGRTNLTAFTIASPTSPSQEKTDNGEEVTEYRKSQSQLSGSPEEDVEQGNEQKDSLPNEDSDNKDESSSSDLSFKKKDVKKSRTQSFQSVLSTASLKSLKQQFSIQTSANPRNNSIISNNSNTANSKNFQSFIQAPVLSSISNLKASDDDIEIGQQLPFHNNKNSLSEDSSNNQADENLDDTYDDQDTIIQQQKLTLNALKKLSLSPMPIINSEDNLIKKPVSRKSSVAKIDNTNKNNKNSEPYQPAEVDLSSFASLTRQPKTNAPEKSSIAQDNENKSSLITSTTQPKNDNFTGNDLLINTNRSNITSSRLPDNVQASSPTSPINQKFDHQQRQGNQIHSNQKHNGNRQHQLNNLQKQPNIYAAVTPPQDMNVRRKSSQQLPSVSSQQQHYQQPHSMPQPHPKKQLQQIKGFRSPMYIPAVLRMTVNNGMSSSSSNPNINSGNLSNLNSTSNSNSPNENLSKSQNNYNADHGYQQNPITLQLAQDPNMITTTSSRDSIKSFDSNVSVESTSSLNQASPSSRYLGSSKKYEIISRAAPTRKHWLRDESVYKCGIPTCPKVFNFFERRHHCRKCGGIYCKEHTSHSLYINHLAQFTTGGRGTLSKVCDDCIEEYNEFMKHEFGINQQSKLINHSNNSSKNELHDKLSELPITYGGRQTSPIKNISANNFDNPNNRNEQLVGSVPANWSWSSF